MRTRITPLFFCLLTAASAQGLRPPADAGDPVGWLGAPSALMFEGDLQVKESQLRQALFADPEIAANRHPLAPLSLYQQAIKLRLSYGYQASGFPDARVTVSRQAECLVVEVDAGPFLPGGELTIVGADKELTQAIRERLTQPWPPPDRPIYDKNGVAEEPSEAIWSADKGAMFHSLDPHREHLQHYLRSLGWFDVQFSSKVVRRQTNADWEIKIIRQGERGTIGRITTTGLQRTERAALLKRIEVEEGMLIESDLVTRIQRKLQQSARFETTTTELTPLPDRPSDLHLEIDVRELPDAPPLQQALSPGLAAMPKLASYLSRLDQLEGENLIVDLHVADKNLTAQIVVLPEENLFVSLTWSGHTVQAWTTDDLLHVGLPDLLGKPSWSYPLKNLKLSASFLPNDEPGEKRSSLQGSVGWKSAAKQDLNLELLVLPAFLLRNYHDADVQVEDGEVIVKQAENHLRFDAISGRLLSAKSKKDNLDITIRSDAEFVLPTGTKDASHEMLMQGLEDSEWLAPISPMVRLLTRQLDAKPKPEPEPAASSNEMQFTIPRDQPVNPTGIMIRMMLEFLIRDIQHDSWPSILGYTWLDLMNQRGTYYKPSMKHLVEQTKLGPLGCWAAMTLNRQLRREKTMQLFALLGKKRATAQHFRRDIDPWIQAGSPRRAQIDHLLEQASKLQDDEADAIIKLLSEHENLASVSAMINAARAHPDDAEDRLNAVLAILWEKEVAPLLLQQFDAIEMPQRGF